MSQAKKLLYSFSRSLKKTYEHNVNALNIILFIFSIEMNLH